MKVLMVNGSPRKNGNTELNFVLEDGKVISIEYFLEQ